MKKRLIQLGALLVVIALSALLIYLYRVHSYQNKVSHTTVQNIEFSSIPDGSYIGDYNVDFIYAKVSVTVKSGKVIHIDLLKHKTERGKPAEVITDKIVEQQTLEVDAIAGATNSSKVIKKAVENALNAAKAPKP